MMTKRYNLDPGYITVPEANSIVLRMLRIVDQNDKSHYRKILNGAKEGLFGGKKHGKRMYQVRREEIIKYAENCLRNEQMQLFNIEIANTIKEDKSPMIDYKNASKIQSYLKYLRFYDIISENVFHQSEKKLIMRMKMNEIDKVN